MLALLLTGSVLAAQPTKRPSDAERGEELYRRHCVACHGVANDGKGPITTQLVATVPALAGQVKADDATAEVVLRGKSAMPGYHATFDKADAVRVLKFMMNLSDDKPLPAATAAIAPARPVKPIKKPPEDDTPEGPGADGPEADLDDAPGGQE